MASTLAATNGCTSAGPLRPAESMPSASISSSVGRDDAARVAGLTSTRSEATHTASLGFVGSPGPYMTPTVSSAAYAETRAARRATRTAPMFDVMGSPDPRSTWLVVGGQLERSQCTGSYRHEVAHERLNPRVQCLLRGLPHPFDTVQRNLSSDRRNNPLTDDIGGDNVLIPIRPPLRRQRGSTLDVTEAKVRRVVADRQCRPVLGN